MKTFSKTNNISSLQGADETRAFASPLKRLLLMAGLSASVLLAACGAPAEDNGPGQGTGEQSVATATTVAQAEVTVATATAQPDIIEPPTGAPPSATSTTVASQPFSETTYVVQAGDTLGAIAARFNTSVDALMAANGLDSPDLIFVGQTLRIVGPGAVQAAATPTTATVAGGDPTAVAPLAQTPTQPPAQPPTAAVVAEATRPAPVTVNGRTYTAYVETVIKEGQWFSYTCEFDSAWIVLKTFGFDVPLEEQTKIIGLDTSIEPYYTETADGVVIYGGDVRKAYSGDYKKNFLARSSGKAMRKVFDAYNLPVEVVNDRAAVERALDKGWLIWFKATVDFKPWREATWIMPDGSSYQTVLGNDHALVIIGYNEDVVVIRDPLGPTSTNLNRAYEYEVPWEQFLPSWGAQQYDGLAVGPPEL